MNKTRYQTRRAEDDKQLTTMELTVLRLLDADLRPAQVAKMLHLALPTVRMHVRNINAKLQTHSYYASLFVARRSGLLDT